MKSNCQHHIFRSMEKRDGETVAQFSTRLRQVVRDCDHGDQAENQIGDQVSSVAIHKIWGENNLKKKKPHFGALAFDSSDHESAQSPLSARQVKDMVCT